MDVCLTYFDENGGKKCRKFKNGVVSKIDVIYQYILSKLGIVYWAPVSRIVTK